MLLRIRSQDGNFRFQFEPGTSIQELRAKIIETASSDIDPETIRLSNQPRGGEVNINTLRGRPLKDLGLSHGDLLFVSYDKKDASREKNGTVKISTEPEPHQAQVKEDAVDSFWRKQVAKIQRPRDAKLCTHGTMAMCEYCSPLEPFDPSYHAKNGIKHLSFHSYLRKIAPVDSHSGNSNIPHPLSNLSYRVKVPCPSGTHPPWPASICTACQPSAITLQSQPFRMVDHLEFASDSIIDRFLEAWRATGTQRFGWLIGHYEPYAEVPMGIKAVVEAIHEPPQEGELDGITLGIPWEDEGRIRHLCSLSAKPLVIVGQIFTDLTVDQEDKTKVLYKRHPQSFYLSSLEIALSAELQLQNPSSSKLSSSGTFSSRLVTAVLSGTESGGVDVSAYQVSEQACAMVDADLIEPSVEPGIMRVKEEDSTSSPNRYVPDVFFRYKNEYGRDVQKSAKPSFPVEYLLVNVTHGFPKVPSPMFRSSSFPIENRPGLEDSSNTTLFKHILQHGEVLSLRDSNISSENATKRELLIRSLSDWHFLSYVGSLGLLSDEDLTVLSEVATASSNDAPASLDKLLARDGWRNLTLIAQESADTSHSVPSRSAMEEEIPPEVLNAIESETGTSSNLRICPHCTFENTHSGTDCDVCGLPLNQ